MQVNELIRIASAAYPDGLIAEEYWDFERGHPRKNPDGGDTLAQFIANEISDTYDPDATDRAQIRTVRKALSMARGDLAAVMAALTRRSEQMKKRVN